MKLIDVLSGISRQIERMPEHAAYCVQDSNGDLKFGDESSLDGLKFRDGVWHRGGVNPTVILGTNERLADDHAHAVVTRAEWMAMIEKKKSIAEKKADEERLPSIGSKKVFLRGGEWVQVEIVFHALISGEMVACGLNRTNTDMIDIVCGGKDEFKCPRRHRHEQAYDRVASSFHGELGISLEEFIRLAEGGVVICMEDDI